MLLIGRFLAVEAAGQTLQLVPDTGRLVLGVRIAGGLELLLQALELLLLLVDDLEELPDFGLCFAPICLVLCLSTGLLVRHLEELAVLRRERGLDLEQL